MPSWFNVMKFPLMYYHNVLQSSTLQRPVVFLDLLPFRDELMQNLELSQQVVPGEKYALRKWMAHAHATIPPPAHRLAQWEHAQAPLSFDPSSYFHPPPTDCAGTTGRETRSSTFTEAYLAQMARAIHPSWHGRLVLELDGTSEALHDLIVRCAGPRADPRTSKALLERVLDPRCTAADRALPPLHLAPPGGGGTASSTTTKTLTSLSSSSTAPLYAFPFQVMLDRSQPGMVVLQPLTVVTGLR